MYRSHSHNAHSNMKRMLSLIMQTIENNIIFPALRAEEK